MIEIITNIVLSLIRLVDVKEIALRSNVKSFYQYLRYNNSKTILIQSKKFETDGLRRSQFDANTYQLAVPKSALTDTVMRLDDYLSTTFSMPAITRPSFQIAEPYKKLTDKTHDDVFIKVDTENLRVFDFERNEIHLDDISKLQHGEYKVIIKICGIYIGSHGSIPKYASLQMKIIQIMYRQQFENDCYFTTDETTSLTTSSPPSPQLPLFDSEEPPQQSVKATLPRQSAFKRKSVTPSSSKKKMVAKVPPVINVPDDSSETESALDDL